jgi:rifampicin phosphotransferase
MKQQRTFTAPGPGVWMLDVTHCQTPRSRFMSELFAECYSNGFRDGFARYGALLDTIEYSAIEGFPYIAIRPLGAPKDAKGTPPRFIFSLLLRLHPALRRRRARAEEVMRDKIWREDRRVFMEQVRPRLEAALRTITDEDPAKLDDPALLDHFKRLRALMKEGIHDHFYRAPAAMLPVGDYVASAQEWTGCTRQEAVELLRGASPDSVSSVTDVDAVVEALRAAPALLAEVESGDDARAILDRLEQAGNPVGPAAREWLARHGERLVGGHDLTDRRAIEVPATLVATLRARLAGQATHPPVDPGKLRARVPEGHRAEFDALLDEARHVYGLRDARMSIDWWSLGLARRVMLAIGTRAAKKGAIGNVDEAFDLSAAEVQTVLTGGTVDRDDLAKRAEWRATAQITDAPQFIGGQPGKPPPSSWIPGAAGRIARAVGIYIEMMNEDVATDEKSLTGVGASPGKYTGTARIIRTATDFDRVRPGDVLIAPITSPTYNVVLPLLGAIVTDRGGLLSHPAIISREYGIPAVVGARGATSQIREGSRVEVDGGSGVVRVVA